MNHPRTWAVAALLALSLPATAGVNTFTATGPDGAICYDIEFAGGGALLVTTSRGLYRSTDNAASWTRVRDMENWGPRRLAVNPANRNQVLLGGTGGLTRSTDGGATWSVVGGLPLQNNYVGVLKFSSDGSVAWMAQQNGGLIYRSTDGGATWTESDTGLTNPPFALAVDSANPQLIYLRSADGAFRSGDGGSTLTPLTPLTFAQHLTLFTTSPTTANTALVFSGDDYRVYRTTNGGVDWNTTAWTPVPGRTLETLQYVPGVVGKAWAVDREYRMYRSLDDGDNWTDLGFAPNGMVYGMAFDPADPTHIFMATTGGVFESTDDGAHWAERNRGLREGSSLDLVSSRAGAGELYLKTRDLASVYRRAASGDWIEVGRSSAPLLGLPSSLNSYFGAYTLGVSQQDAQRLYMAREGKFGVSTDGGANWTLLSNVPHRRFMSLSPVNDRLVFLSDQSLDLVRSTNGGVSWDTPAVQGLAPLPKSLNTFAFDPTNANVVYGAVDNYLPPETSAVYKSVDGGANFVPTAWDTAHNASLIWKLVHDPVRTNIVYVSAFSGLFKTTDGGGSWTKLPLFSEGAQIASGAVDLIVDPQSPEVLYASAWQRPWVARSVDGGLNWDIMRESDALEQFTHIALVPGTRTKLVAQRWNGMREVEFVARVGLGVNTRTVTVNAPATSVFNVTNQGTFTVSGLRLTATLPASSAAYSVASAGGTCAVASTTLACDFANLAPNAQSSVTVGYTPTSVGNWSATLASYEPDDNAADNVAQVVVAAPPPPGGNAGSGGGGGGGRLDYLLLALLVSRLLPLSRHSGAWSRPSR